MQSDIAPDIAHGTTPDTAHGTTPGTTPDTAQGTTPGTTPDTAQNIICPAPQHAVDDITLREIEAKVERQYTVLPYPQPNAEKKIESRYSIFNDFDILAHHVFGGFPITEDFTFLDAGCGTGNSIVLFAKQFKERHFTTRNIWGIDISETSLNITQQTLETNELSQFVNLRKLSIFDLPQLCESGEFPKFDFIQSYGVIHHTGDPQRALQCLAQCLKPTGRMYIMIYGKHGRHGIDVAHSLVTKLTADIIDEHEQIAIATNVLNNLPPNNLYSLTQQFTVASDKDKGDSNFYDLLLHQHYTTFSVSEVFELISRVGLQHYRWGIYSDRYIPHKAIQYPKLLELVEQMPQQKQAEICELYNCGITNHEFIAGHKLSPYIVPDITNITLHIIENTILIKSFKKTVLDGNVKSGKIQLNRSIISKLPIDIDITEYVFYFFRYFKNGDMLQDVYQKIANRLKCNFDVVVNQLTPFIEVIIDNYIISLVNYK
jgi:SAM-dependent methyltransferase